jgi:hypothetical protein
VRKESNILFCRRAHLPPQWNEPPEWKALYKLMVEQYYNAFGYNCSLSATFQQHFVDMHSTLKNGIRGLLLVEGAPKGPTTYVDGDDEVEDFAASLESPLSSKKGEVCSGENYHHSATLMQRRVNDDDHASVLVLVLVTGCSLILSIRSFKHSARRKNCQECR